MKFGCSNDVKADKCSTYMQFRKQRGTTRRFFFQILNFTMENYVGAENPAQYKGTGKVFYFFFRNASTIIFFLFLQEHYYVYITRRNGRFSLSDRESTVRLVEDGNRFFFQLAFKIDLLEPLICLNSRRHMSNFGNICCSLSLSLFHIHTLFSSSLSLSYKSRKAIPHYLLSLFAQFPSTTVKKQITFLKTYIDVCVYISFSPV